MTLFDGFPDSSRVWIFPCSETLSAERRAAVVPALTRFMDEWTSHGAGVRGGFEIIYDRFIAIAADTAWGDVSGCSIDSMFRNVSGVVESVGVRLSDNTNFFYRTTGPVVEIDRPGFKKLVQADQIAPGTTVFDNSVTTLADVRTGKWEVPFERSWQAERYKSTSA